MSANPIRDAVVDSRPPGNPPGAWLIFSLFFSVCIHLLFALVSLGNWEGRSYPDDTLFLFVCAALYTVLGVASRRSKRAFVLLGCCVALAELGYAASGSLELVGPAVGGIAFMTAAFLAIGALPGKSSPQSPTTP